MKIEKYICDGCGIEFGALTTRFEFKSCCVVKQIGRCSANAPTYEGDFSFHSTECLLKWCNNPKHQEIKKREDSYFEET